MHQIFTIRIWLKVFHCRRLRDNPTKKKEKEPPLPSSSSTRLTIAIKTVYPQQLANLYTRDICTRNFSSHLYIFSIAANIKTTGIRFLHLAPFVYGKFTIHFASNNRRPRDAAMPLRIIP